MTSRKIIGPFKQLLSLDSIPLKGPVRDEQLRILEDAGIWVENGYIREIAPYKELTARRQAKSIVREELEKDHVGIPGLVDAHTHICFGGSRAMDYAMRLSGKTYLDIAAMGGGIKSTVAKTNEADFQMLKGLTRKRALRAFSDGVTTIEIKSGYGLSVPGEMKMLEVINALKSELTMDIIPTCLAAHTLPAGFSGSHTDYLTMVLNELLPQVLSKNLARRVDIFLDKSAFNREDGIKYLQKARQMGFELTVHADQFTTGGSEVAVLTEALSADHLEASTDKEIKLLAESNTVAVCLPGASMGLGEKYAPARKLLNAGACVAIASDWNPGSAPMGDLLLQASVLAASERLTSAETLSALTFRAARALNLPDRGMVKEGFLADFIAFPTADYRDILYFQGKMKPTYLWKRGNRINLSRPLV